MCNWQGFPAVPTKCDHCGRRSTLSAVEEAEAGVKEEGSVDTDVLTTAAAGEGVAAAVLTEEIRDHDNLGKRAW